MRRSAVLLLTLALAGSYLSGEPGGEIRGRVVGVGGRPVAGAVVLHRPSAARLVTDAGGGFVLDLPAADGIRLEVRHPEYHDLVFSVPGAAAGRELVIMLSPLISRREEIVVTALRYPEPSVRIPAAETVIRGETLSAGGTVNITEGLRDVPGVGALGTGGFSLVPSIRGLARRRVLFLIDGARLESDRRTGPNASFVSPEDIDRIEVLRSSSSVFHGSDAVGGVIHLLTRRPSFEPGIRGRLSTGYGFLNAEKSGGVRLEGASGRTAFLLSVQGRDAGNYHLPDGSAVRQSQYTQGSLLARISHRTDRRELELSFLGGRGVDIGKPNITAEASPTWYPRENQNLIQFRWQENNVGGAGDLLFQAFANPNFLETRTDTYRGLKTAGASSRTQSTDFGAQLSYGRRIVGEVLRIEGGLDYFGRAGARALNTYSAFDAAGLVTSVREEASYDHGRRSDVGLFLSADYTGIGRLDLLAGVRYDSLGMEALPLGAARTARARDTAATGFLGASYGLTEELTAFVNAGRAYRVPSLGERFYTGISGRGFIIGQPGLEPETSLNLDGGLKFLGRRFFAGLYVFRYDIKGMIERYRPDPATYTYGNIDRGRVDGWEFEADWFLRPGWNVFGCLSSVRGRSLATEENLNDIPPVRLSGGSRIWLGLVSLGLTGSVQLEKDNPGPAEVSIPGAAIVDFRAVWTCRRWDVYLTVANLFNVRYLARPEAEAMPEPARSLRLGIARAF